MSTSALSPLDTSLPFATNFGTAIRQAQDLRKAGKFDAAARVLAQLVIASPDDPRVIGEYGKLMLEAGRLDDATSFLERAVVLQPSDWTLFSALGVAYDQSGRSDAARVSFQRALALSPNESTVLSNLAISHMLAGELDEAERLLVQASEQRKDIPGISAKLAMVRNIRSTTAQSRPLAVSALPLPQPIVPPVNSEADVTPTVVAPTEPPAMDAAPMLQEPAPQEPIEDEFESSPDDAETQEVAQAAAPVVLAEIPVDKTATSYSIINMINDISNVKHEPVAIIAEPGKKTATSSAVSAKRKSSNTNVVKTISKAKNQQQDTAATKAKPGATPPNPPVTTQASVAETKAVQPVKVSPKTVAEAKPRAPKVEPVLEPIPAQVWVTESKLTQVASLPPAPTIVKPAPEASQPRANPTAQAAVMTRRADAASVVARTAPVPLVLLLAPAPLSWESAVRVSLPQASAAGLNPVVRAEPIDRAKPPAGAGSWSDILRGWVTAALGFITAFWA